MEERKPPALFFLYRGGIGRRGGKRTGEAFVYSELSLFLLSLPTEAR